MLQKTDIKHHKELEMQPKYDTVYKPKHYMLFEQYGIEARDVVEQLAKKIQENAQTLPTNSLFMSDYVQMMYYGMRFMEKNGEEDLKKMRWYLDKLLLAYGETK